MTKHARTLLAVLCLALAFVAPAHASLQATSLTQPMAGTAALMPRGLVRFCIENASECTHSGAAEAAWTPDLQVLLQRVNSQVNTSIRPLRDTRDVWTLNPPAGDCEDYALTKRSVLVESGVPAGALRIAFTYTRRGVPHAVLVVRTSQGDLVLDNLGNSVKSLAASGYRIRSMSDAVLTRWVTGSAS